MAICYCLESMSHILDCVSCYYSKNSVEMGLLAYLPTLGLEHEQ
jgi:hypothetical protein